MSTALKPAITPSGPQPAPVPTQINKQMPTQNASTYGQNSTHLTQNFVSLTQTTQSNVHSQTNHSNHYSLNVPNAAQHLANTTNQSNFSISTTLPSVTPTYANNTETSLLSTTQNVSCSPEKPQSNGTPDTPHTTTAITTTNTTVTVTTNSNLQQNHITQDSEKTSTQHIPPTEINKDEKPPVTANDQNHTKDNKQELPPLVSLSSTSECNNISEDKESVTDSLPQVEEKEVTKMEADSVDVTPTNTEESTPTKREQNIVTTPKSSMKPTRILRKIKTTKPDDTTKMTENAIVMQKSPSLSRKSKRNRTTAQPFQYPLPEIEIISKIASTSHRHRPDDDKLIIFYKKEFLAVRNSEGSFYVCQAVQNIYKRSPRIRIRWLSQDKNDKTGELYTPDFYDHIDFDCILTNLQLERVNKGKYRLPHKEQERTDSILKRSLAVEKGDATPGSLTEEHPDGLDLSLYKEESQLKKRKGMKRKASPLKLKSAGGNIRTSKSVDSAKLRKVSVRSTNKTMTKLAVVATTSKKIMPDIKKTNTSSGRSERAKRRSDNSSSDSSPVVDHKKAKVLAKIGRKAAVSSTRIIHKTNTKVASRPTNSTLKQRKVIASTSQAAALAVASTASAASTRKTKRTRK